jgi:hypothetical protein
MALQACSLSTDVISLAGEFSLLVHARLSVSRTFVDFFDRGLERRRVTAGYVVTLSGSIYMPLVLVLESVFERNESVVQLS